MGRYYRIEIGTAVGTAGGGAGTGTGTNASATGVGGGSSAVFTNRLPNGKTDPGAQTVELDLPVTVAATPMGQASVKIWGVSLQQTAQAANFNNQNIAIYGGMQNGLPLATRMAPYAGLLVQGYVLQAFGNWLGLAQSLDFVISTDGSSLDFGTQAQPLNLTFHWVKGQPMADALRQALSVAYPSPMKLDIEISDKLVLPADENGVYATFNQFADYVKRLSQGILGNKYPGVDMIITGNTVYVFDGTTTTGAPTPTQLDFIDMIGQPTWIGPFQVQFNTVMRADIGVGDTVKFPPLSMYQTATTAQSSSQYRDQSTFTGSWQIQQLRHVGNSRDPDGGRWITSFFANALTPPTPWTQPQNTLDLKATSA